MLFLKNYLKRNKTKKSFKKIGDNFSINNCYKVIGGKYISIGNNFYCEKNAKFQAWDCYRGIALEKKPEIIIGDNVKIMENFHVSAINRVVISNGCLIGDNVFITDNYHGDNSFEVLNIPPFERPLFSKGQVIIGKNVWIGKNVCIMPGVTIGDYCVIGANAVVTKSFPTSCVLAGCPAKVIKIIDNG